MSVDHIKVFVEEESVEIALHALIPKIIADTEYEVHSFGGKSRLLAALPGRLRAYSKYEYATWRILVIVDLDKDDCEALKSKLDKITTDARLKTRSTSDRGPYVVNRIAIEPKFRMELYYT